MRPDGTDVRRLTVNTNGDTEPSWASYNDLLAFWGTRANGQTIYILDTQSGGITPLLPPSLRPFQAAWSPMGAPIVFTGYRPESGHSEIMRVEPDGTGLALLTENLTNFDYSPGWLMGRGW